MTRKLIIPDALMFYENAADMQVSAKCAKAIAALNQEEPPAAQARDRSVFSGRTHVPPWAKLPYGKPADQRYGK